jgi:flagellar hook-associated protein 1 FlgK
LGGLIQIRGTDFNDDGVPTNGTLGEMFSSLNSLAQGIIRSVNSIYSYSAQSKISTDTLSQPVSISPDLAKEPIGVIQKFLKAPVRNGNMEFNVYDNDGNLKNTIKISVNTSESVNQIVNEINKAVYQNDNDATYGAQLIDGQIKFVKGSYDSNGNFTASYPPEESPNILVKDDGTNLFHALNEIEYIPLSEINDTTLPIPMKNGSFDVVTYDDNGNVLAKRKITVDMNSDDPRYSTLAGIAAQINTQNIDDNQDNNPNDDVDDLYEAQFINGKFIMTPKKDNIYVGLDDDTANFGGAIGVNKFFEGNNAFNIKLKDDLAENPSNIHAYKAPNEGNNEVANEILQLQFKNIDFYKNGETYSNTIYGYYSNITSNLANETQTISNKKETTQTLLNSVSKEYYSVAGVNIDDELINLEKYQRGYQANAKVITTINKMLDALFSINP